MPASKALHLNSANSTWDVRIFRRRRTLAERRYWVVLEAQHEGVEVTDRGRNPRRPGSAEPKGLGGTRSRGVMAHTVSAAALQSVRWRQWVGPVALFLVGLALYSINLDKPPRFDELYHVLGARGYLEHGKPRIAEAFMSGPDTSPL
jgi:hypothetical protein